MKTFLNITREEFEAYEKVRASGKTNMYAISNVEVMSKLDRETIIAVMENYSKLMKKFPEVRK